jgi:hypothetical protein
MLEPDSSPVSDRPVARLDEALGRSAFESSAMPPAHLHDKKRPAKNLCGRRRKVAVRARQLPAGRALKRTASRGTEFLQKVGRRDSKPIRTRR